MHKLRCKSFSSLTIDCYHMPGNLLFYCVEKKLVLTNVDCVINMHEYLNQRLMRNNVT